MLDNSIQALELRYLQWRCINIQFEKQLQTEEKEYQYLLQCITNQLANSSLLLQDDDTWLQQWQQHTKQEANQFQLHLIESSKKLSTFWKQLHWQDLSTLENLRQMVCFYQENKPAIANQYDLGLLERRIHQWVMYLIHCHCNKGEKKLLEYKPIVHVLRRQLESHWNRIQRKLYDYYYYGEEEEGGQGGFIHC